MPQQRDRIVLQSDVVLSASTALQPVTGLNFAVQVGRKYHFRAHLVVTGTATVGWAPAISANPTTAATLFASMFTAADGQGTIDGGGASSYAATGAALLAAGTVTTTANLVAAGGSNGVLEGMVVPAATQVLQLEVQPETATAMTIKAGSYIEWELL